MLETIILRNMFGKNLNVMFTYVNLKYFFIIIKYDKLSHSKVMVV